MEEILPWAAVGIRQPFDLFHQWAMAAMDCCDTAIKRKGRKGAKDAKIILLFLCGLCAFATFALNFPCVEKPRGQGSLPGKS